MKRIKLIGVLTAVVLSLIVILQNTQPVAISFLFIHRTMPNAVLLGLVLLLGMALGILIALHTMAKRGASKNR